MTADQQLEPTARRHRRCDARALTPWRGSYFVLRDPDSGRLLLVEHHTAGLLVLTGGHVEPGEDPYDTVVREAAEELRDGSMQQCHTTYNGGTGIYEQSYVINYAINQGSLIATMRTNAVPASVNTYLLCGNSPSIPNWNNETDGPSDGTIFLASCTDTGVIAPSPARPLSR